MLSSQTYLTESRAIILPMGFNHADLHCDLALGYIVNALEAKTYGQFLYLAKFQVRKESPQSADEIDSWIFRIFIINGSFRDFYK